LSSCLPVVSRTLAVTFSKWLATADSIMDVFAAASSCDGEFGAYRAPGRKCQWWVLACAVPAGPAL